MTRHTCPLTGCCRCLLCVRARASRSTKIDRSQPSSRRSRTRSSFRSIRGDPTARRSPSQGRAEHGAVCVDPRKKVSLPMHTHSSAYHLLVLQGVETLERGQRKRTSSRSVPAAKVPARNEPHADAVCPRMQGNCLGGKTQARGAAQEVRRSREPRTAELALLHVSRTRFRRPLRQDGDMAARGADRDELERRGVTSTCPVEPEVSRRRG
jgi:mannose-6-phosphate isomerase-like protein (cupin superfamily)